MSRTIQDRKRATVDAKTLVKLEALTPFEKRVVERLRVHGPESVRSLAAALWSSDPTGRSKVCNVVGALRSLREARLARGVGKAPNESWRLSAWATRALRAQEGKAS